MFGEVKLHILIATYTRHTQLCNFEWPWVTLSDLANFQRHGESRGLTATAELLVTKCIFIPRDGQGPGSLVKIDRENTQEFFPEWLYVEGVRKRYTAIQHNYLRPHFWCTISLRYGMLTGILCDCV